MLSRLDRLFRLLESGSSVARSSVAEQLASVQHSHPDDLKSLLERIESLSLKSDWESRIAAGKAFDAVISEVMYPIVDYDTPLDDPTEVVMESIDCLNEFDLFQVISNDKSLGATTAECFEIQCEDAPVHEKRARVDKHLGLNPTLGVGSKEWIQDSDLQQQQSSYDSSQSSSISGDHLTTPPVKRLRTTTRKIRNLNFRVDLITAVDNSNLPVLQFACKLLPRMKNERWESRHGAAILLNSFVSSCYFKTAMNHSVQTVKLETTTYNNVSKLHIGVTALLAEMCFQLMVLDRFNDFVGAQVVAPVRETCAQIIVSIYLRFQPGALSGDQPMEFIGDVIEKILNELMRLSNEKSVSWEYSHATLLCLKYLVVSVASLSISSDTEVMRGFLSNHTYYQFLIICLSSSNEELSSLAAQTLLNWLKLTPVDSVKSSEMETFFNQVTSTVYSLIQSHNECSNSVEVPNRENEQPIGGDTAIDCLLELIVFIENKKLRFQTQPLVSLTKQISIFLPYFDSPQCRIRSAAVRCCVVICERTFSENTIECTSCAPFFTMLLRVILQRILLENNKEIQLSLTKLWRLIVNDGFDTQSQLVASLCPYVGVFLSFLMIPSTGQLDSRLLVFDHLVESSARNSPFLDGPHFIGSEELSCLTGDDKLTMVLENQIFVAECLAQIFDQICRFREKLEEVCDFHSVANQLFGLNGNGDSLTTFNAEESPSESLLNLLLFYLKSGSALQIRGICMVLFYWATQTGGKNAESIPESLIQCITSLLENPPKIFQESVTNISEVNKAAEEFLTSAARFNINLNARNQSVAPSIFATIQDAQNLADLKIVDVLNPILVRSSEKIQLENYQNILINCLETFKANMEHHKRRTALIVAATLISAKVLTLKISFIIKPLMDTIKFESIRPFVNIAAQSLSRCLRMLSEKPQSPASKIIKNLFILLDSFPQQRERLKLIESSTSETATSVMSFDLLLKVPQTSRRNAKSISIQDDEDSNMAEAAKLCIEKLCFECSDKLPELVPDFWKFLIEIDIDSYKSKQIVQFVHVCENVFPTLHVDLKTDLYMKQFNLLIKLCTDPSMAVRNVLSNYIVVLVQNGSDTLLNLLYDQFMVQLLNMKSEATIESTISAFFIEMVYCLITRIKNVTKLFGLISIFVTETLRLLSHPLEPVRHLASLTFGQLVRLSSLETSSSIPTYFPVSLRDRWTKDSCFISQLCCPSNIPQLKLPFKLDVQLRPYQQEGITWMWFLREYSINGILCDDMGLGKTLQSLCVVASSHHDAMAKNEINVKSIIICPASVVAHWDAEIRNFFGKNHKCLTSMVIWGSLTAAMMSRVKNENWNILILPYSRMRSFSEHFKDYYWHYVLLDEGHVIKNSKTQLFQSINSLKAKYKLILSGTPIQNSVLELWSLFHFLMPGYLGSLPHFDAKFGKPILLSRDAKATSEEANRGKRALELLHKQVLPLVLRRQKEDVLKDLPPKIIQDVTCDLTALQIELYEDFSDNLAKSTDSTNCDSTKLNVLQTLIYLRKLCDHPILVLDPSHAKYEHIVARYASAGQDVMQLCKIEHSGKLVALHQLLAECGIGSLEEEDVPSEEATLKPVSEHRALIFCQFRSMVHLLASFFDAKAFGDVTYMRLDGTVPVQERQLIVDRFNADASIDILLLTTQIGGLGLNLTGADVVIFVDHDWNPSKDLQAMDRAHRIGQKKTVNVYRLLAKGTIEEKMLNYQRFKQHVAGAVIGDENSSLSSMATDNLLDLLSLQSDDDKEDKKGKVSHKNATVVSLPDLWDESHYDEAFSVDQFMKKNV